MDEWHDRGSIERSSVIGTVFGVNPAGIELSIVPGYDYPRQGKTV
jgi:hypothetical protein